MTPGWAPEPAGVGSVEFTERLTTLEAAVAQPGSVVLLTGPEGLVASIFGAGMGLPEALVQSARLVSAGQPMPYRAILEATLSAYGFHVEPGTGADVMADLVAEQGLTGPGGDGHAVIIIDDAGLVPAHDLEALLALVRGRALTLVLAGLPALVPVVERITRQLGVDWREVSFQGLGAGGPDPQAGSIGPHQPVRRGQALEAGQRRRAGRSQQPRSSLQPLRELLRDLLDRLGSPRLGGRGSARRQEQTAAPLAFPRRHLVLLGVVVAGLLVLYLLVRMGEGVNESARGDQRVETLAMPPLPALDRAGANGLEGDDSGAGSSGPTERVALPVPDAAAGTSVPPVAAPAPIIARPATGPAGNAQAVAADAPEPPARSASVAQTPAVVAATRPADSRPQAVAGAAATLPGVAHGSDWILAQSASAFTLQLASLSSAERALAYIGQQPDPTAFATYRLLRNGQLFHVIVYGNYPTKMAAQAAAGRLPGTVGKIQPWVRSFGQIQESIRTTPQR